jgi:hypothetical protein
MIALKLVGDGGPEGDRHCHGVGSELQNGGLERPSRARSRI